MGWRVQDQLCHSEQLFFCPERECLAIGQSVNSLKSCFVGMFITVTDCDASLNLKEDANFNSRFIHWHLAFAAAHIWYQACKKEDLGNSPSRIDSSHLNCKSLDQALQSDLNSSEAKELHRVYSWLFRTQIRWRRLTSYMEACKRDFFPQVHEEGCWLGKQKNEALGCIWQHARVFSEIDRFKGSSMERERAWTRD